MLLMGGEDDEPVSVPLTKVGESQNASGDEVPSELPEGDAEAKLSFAPDNAAADSAEIRLSQNVEAKPAEKCRRTEDFKAIKDSF